MKDWQKHLVTFLIGAGAAMCLCLTCNPRVGGKDALVQSDTIVKYETLHYSRLELAKNTIKLDVPKISARELVFIEESSLDTIYIDSVRYVTLPRQYYHTKTQDAEIWHSGIDSTIDSLAVFRNDMVISKKETTTQTVTKRHGLSIGIETNYATIPCFPVQLEYAYHIKPWFNIYGYAEYELLRKQWGIGIGTKIEISW